MAEKVNQGIKAESAMVFSPTRQKQNDINHYPLRYSFAGDEHLFAEIVQDMSLSTFFYVLKLAKTLKVRQLPGVLDICLANASLLVRFNPDILSAHSLLNIMQALENTREENPVLVTRIIEVPVLYNDPWTRETLMRFRDRHQAPGGSDLDYVANINGYSHIDDLVSAHCGTPWFVTAVGFAAGLPFMYQMVEREKQIQAPKYIRPRTDTPAQALGHGGCFSCFYSVRGAGGYQLLGITPMPVYLPEQSSSLDKMVFFRAGDIVQFRPIDRHTFNQIEGQVKKGVFTPCQTEVTFMLADYLRDPLGYSQQLKRELDDDYRY